MLSFRERKRSSSLNIVKENWRKNIIIILFLDTDIYPYKFDLDMNSYYINLGDWITHFTFGVLMGNPFLEKWKNPIYND